MNNINGLTDIALTYGMSLNEIVEFNDFSSIKKVKEKLEKNGSVTLRIPSIIGQSAQIILDESDKFLKGCDMSKYQPCDSVNWEKLSKILDFIILKSNTGLTSHNEFEQKVAKAIEFNIPIGVYCYNCTNIEEKGSIEKFKKNQESQTNRTVDMLKNLPIDLDINL